MIREAPKQHLPGNKVEDGVAQKFEPLVVAQVFFSVLVDVGAMRQRLLQQQRIAKNEAVLPLKFFQIDQPLNALKISETLCPPKPNELLIT